MSSKEQQSSAHNGAMNYAAAKALCERTERTRDLLEQRERQLRDLFRPLLVAWLGKDDARSASIRQVKVGERHVELIYGWFQGGRDSRDYNVFFARDVCESPNAVGAVEALRQLERKNEEDARRKERIHALQRELNSLLPSPDAGPKR